MNVALVGATGNIGSKVLAELVSRGPFGHRDRAQPGQGAGECQGEGRGQRRE